MAWKEFEVMYQPSPASTAGGQTAHSRYFPRFAPTRVGGGGGHDLAFGFEAAAKF